MSEQAIFAIVPATFGVSIRPSRHVPDGTQIWMRGQTPIGITSKARNDFYSMFGLTAEAPKDADGVVISLNDFEELRRLDEEITD